MATTPGFCEILIEGADARNFLQSQLASDVRTLEPARWQHASYCAADGRVQALALLACVDGEHFRLLLPADLAESVLARLQRFRLRARCTLALQPVAIAAGDAGEAGARWRGPTLDWRVLASETPEPLPPALWQSQLAHGIPWLVAATGERWLPQMLALDRLGAFSLRKGCYPGQEIIARTHYLGRAKRRLVRARLEPDTRLPAGTELHSPQGSGSGALLAVADAGNALAVVNEAVVAGDHLAPADAHGMATVVIESDVLGTIGDATLNEYLPV